MCTSKWICYFKYLMLLAVFVGMSVFAQSGNINREKFDPTKNPSEDLKIAVKTATAENKRILLDVGGEWCIWCHRIDEFIETNEDVKSSLTSAFVILKVNYSKENKNEEFLGKFPTIEGYPHFFVLENDGSLTVSQNTGDLEDGKSYSKEKFLEFVAKYKK
ncbi:MAG: thioredoxin family protein [Ignavibacteriales bacterium]|nr:thioredoxin family protein [Ignavibacteriales bacterium]